MLELVLYIFQHVQGKLALHQRPRDYYVPTNITSYIYKSLWLSRLAMIIHYFDLGSIMLEINTNITYTLNGDLNSVYNVLFSSNLWRCIQKRECEDIPLWRHRMTPRILYRGVSVRSLMLTLPLSGCSALGLRESFWSLMIVGGMCSAVEYVNSRDVCLFIHCLYFTLLTFEILSSLQTFISNKSLQLVRIRKPFKSPFYLWILFSVLNIIIVTVANASKVGCNQM